LKNLEDDVGHLLSSVNPEAAARIEGESLGGWGSGDPAVESASVEFPAEQFAPAASVPTVDYPLPAVSSLVQYHLREGDFQSRRNVFAALVLACRDDGSLDLLVFRDADDLVGMQGVPPRRGTDAGWVAARHAEGAGNGALQSSIEDLIAVIFGADRENVPTEPIAKTLNDLIEFRCWVCGEDLAEIDNPLLPRVRAQDKRIAALENQVAALVDAAKPRPRGRPKKG
jgi:hypothetical protein